MPNSRRNYSSQENVDQQIEATAVVIGRILHITPNHEQKAEIERLLRNLLHSIDFPQLVESQEKRRASREKYNKRK